MTARLPPDLVELCSLLPPTLWVWTRDRQTKDWWDCDLGAGVTLTALPTERRQGRMIAYLRVEKAIFWHSTQHPIAPGKVWGETATDTPTLARHIVEAVRLWAERFEQQAAALRAIERAL